jgi:hypothetical protein
MLPFQKAREHREYHALLQKIGQAEHEIGILEGLGQAVSPTTDNFDRSLTTLRASLATQGLTTKRQELETLRSRAATMLERDPNLARPLPAPKPPPPPLDRRRVAIMGLTAVLIIVAGVIVARRLLAPPVIAADYLIAPTLGQLVTEPGGKYYSGPPISINYKGGKVTLSGNPTPDGKFTVDDRLSILITHPDGSTQTWDHTFNDDCVSNHALPSQEVTGLFKEGVNIITVSLYDACGGAAGTDGPVFVAIR